LIPKNGVLPNLTTISHRFWPILSVLEQERRFSEIWQKSWQAQNYYSEKGPKLAKNKGLRIVVRLKNGRCLIIIKEKTLNRAFVNPRRGEEINTGIESNISKI
jgi:hypothetical protein